MSSTTSGSDDARLRGRRVLLGVSGGIAAYKSVLVARLLVQAGAEVDVVMTRGAARFIGAPTFEGITGRRVRSEVWEDVDTETHVALARAADVVVIYPATAHTLAKAAAGLADDLLTTSLLATTAPLVVAPAMHTEMWQHPATQANVDLLSARGAVVVGPASGPLMGGDVGPGRVVEPAELVAAVRSAIGPGDLRGRRVLVTAGGTREAIDPVRFLGNRATGRMGFAIAARAARRGAVVTLVAGPTDLATPSGVTRVDVVSADDMHRAVVEARDAQDLIVKAAAVADFRPAVVSPGKVKKAAGFPEIRLVPTVDILAELGGWRAASGDAAPVLVGFAAETDDVLANGQAKLVRKGVDLLVVNDVSESDAGFGVDTNRVTILRADATEPLALPLAAKAEIADRILDEALPLLDRAVGPLH